MIYITGDTHGDFSRFDNMNLREDDLVIVLGDAGLNYYLDKKDRRTKEILSKLPCSFFFIHGNHEERPENVPGYRLKTVKGIVSGDVYVEPEFPNLMFAAGGLYSIGDYSCFVINGAYSVDKYYRLSRGFSWFSSEELTDEEMANVMEKAKEAKSVDFVLSHTCPAGYLPTHVFLPFIDQSTVSRRMEEFLDRIADILDYRLWYCGHYHTEWCIDRMRFMYHDIEELRLHP